MSCRPSNMPGWAVAVLAVGCVAGVGFAQSIPLTPTAQASGAVITHELGIEFVTVGSPGNAAYQAADPLQRVHNRGSVGYEYRIGRFEVTTQQWVEFYNAAFDRPADDLLPHLIPPSRWGAVGAAPQTPGARRWAVPAANEMIPVGNISWRMAAMYCNWLHNDKATDRSAFLNGAYDVSTFTFTVAGRFRDQLTHNAGARFWVPTWDEWLKAAHFDPNRNGPGLGGWWTYSHVSETIAVPGPPGQFNSGFATQANFAWNSATFPGFDPFAVSLGAYPTVQSPWGLLDTAGGTAEWTEEAFFPVPGDPLPNDRIWDGSYWTAGGGLDRVFSRGGDFPSYSGFTQGFRIASSVPSPGLLPCVAGLSVWACLRRRRTHENSNFGNRGGHCGGDRFSVLVVAVLAATGLAGNAFGQTIPLSPTAQASGGLVTYERGIEFVTIGAPGGLANPPWPGNGTPGDRAVGRGSVGYEYRIGRFEVTTEQWVEFYNAAFDRPADDLLPHLIPPSRWGAVGAAPQIPGARRWAVPAGNELIPVGNISWRMAAMYCNWLHNDKSNDRSAFLNGAYDVSTFTFTVAGRFRDQLTHNAGARFWVPTWDEWLKAAHYDPNRFGVSMAGWWFYSHASENPPVPGPPGQLNSGFVTQANYGWSGLNFPGFDPFAVPLGAYADVQSPWGLLDTAGGTAEWTEEAFFPGSPGGPSDRFWDGSYWTQFSGLDRITSEGGDSPSYSGFTQGFRIASSVPSPGVLPCVVGAFSWVCLRRRRTAGWHINEHRSVPQRSALRSL